MESVLSAALPIIVLLLMVNLGLELTPADFRRVITDPKLVVVGLIGQMVVLPAVAAAIVLLQDLPSDIALGLLLLSLAPGGLTSNLLTRYARGDVALSVTLTAVASLLSALSVPVLFSIMRHLVGDPGIAQFSVLRISITMFGIVTIPVMVGMAIRVFAPRLVARYAASFRVIAIALLIVALTLSILAGLEEAIRYFALAGFAALTLNFSMTLLAFLGLRLLRVGQAQRVAISLECGLQNVTLALALVSLMGLPAATAIPVQAYAVIMLITATGFMLIMSRMSSAGRAGA